MVCSKTMGILGGFCSKTMEMLVGVCSKILERTLRFETHLNISCHQTWPTLIILIQICWKSRSNVCYKSFLASSDFNCLLIFFANSLSPDHDRQGVSRDMYPYHMALWNCS